MCVPKSVAAAGGCLWICLLGVRALLARRVVVRVVVIHLAFALEKAPAARHCDRLTIACWSQTIANCFACAAIHVQRGIAAPAGRGPPTEYETYLRHEYYATVWVALVYANADGSALRGGGGIPHEGGCAECSGCIFLCEGDLEFLFSVQLT